MILKCFYYHLKWNIFFWTFWAVREQEHQAGSWKPGSCLCVDGFTLEIFGLFRWQSHSQIEGTRFPKVLSRFLTFFDLEDFALLGIVFIITVHWGLLPLLVQWVLSCSTEHCSQPASQENWQLSPRPEPPLFLSPVTACHWVQVCSAHHTTG